MKRVLSTSDVAAMLGVTQASVASWIDRGLIKAGRTPGGHRKVAREEVYAFARRQGLLVAEPAVHAVPRVLVVDDDAATLKTLSIRIRRRFPDWEVLEAPDGFAAGLAVSAARPDIVLLDLRLPGIDGFEVCRRIKSNRESRRTAVIAMTGYPSPETEARILACGACAYLAKPFDSEILVAKLEEAAALCAAGTRGEAP